ncbi:hypothetical protein A2U01_0008502, partial [Trifolium medium]|nr:hypothetical protein [Trifolium medium]
MGFSYPVKLFGWSSYVAACRTENKTCEDAESDNDKRWQ